MSNNQTGKYFKYAIGEILLVVIGILIALQINNWNEGRKDRIKEATILKQINLDFKSNKRQLDSIKINNDKVIAGCDVILSMMPFKKEQATADTLFKYMPIVMNVKTFNPSNGTIEALISSSSFEVIQNDSLRNLLVSWKDRYVDFSEEEQYARDFQIWQLGPYWRENFDFIGGFSDSNMEQMVKPQFMNLWFDKRQSVLEVQNAIRDEGIERYINEIIRLTEDYD
ncbi:MAG: hypothetical protein HKO94_07440 [Flavobacteriaceae bacterium]|nr:hypothetical protein [Flavobacteriaceae bacterium]